MHVEFSYAHFEWLFIVHIRHCSEKSQNLLNQVQEKKKALFVNRPMALQCMTLKYRHKNSMHTMERLVAPLNKSATFSPKHPAQQN